MLSYNLWSQWLVSIVLSFLRLLFLLKLFDFFFSLFFASWRNWLRLIAERLQIDPLGGGIFLDELFSILFKL